MAFLRFLEDDEDEERFFLDFEEEVEEEEDEEEVDDAIISRPPETIPTIPNPSRCCDAILHRQSVSSSRKVTSMFEFIDFGGILDTLALYNTPSLQFTDTIVPSCSLLNISDDMVKTEL